MQMSLFSIMSASSLSARRAWIEIQVLRRPDRGLFVALRKESVDRNLGRARFPGDLLRSLSARRAWIEIMKKGAKNERTQSRSPQGERG